MKDSILLDKAIYMADTCILDTPITENYFCLIVPNNTTQKTAERIHSEVQKVLNKATLTV